MERKGILTEKVDIPFSKSLKMYIGDWKHVLSCLHPLRNACDWPKWTTRGEKKHYISQDDPRYGECFMHVDWYEGSFGTVALHKAEDCPLAKELR